MLFVRLASIDRPLARLAALFALSASCALSPLVACGSSDASQPTGDGGGDTGARLDANGDANADTNAVDASDDAPILEIDSAPPDAAACTQLRIGILGNPGANASSNFQQWLVKSGTSVQRIQTTATEPLSAATLAPFDVIVLDWLTRDYSSAEAATLASWVSAGGGVATMSGYDDNTVDDWHANSLLKPLGVAYSGALRNGPVTDFVAHPTTTGLSSVTFNGGYLVADLGGTTSTRTPIAFLPEGSGKGAVGIAVQMGAGHAFVWGDEWIEFDSEWSTLPAIKQFWVQIFSWVAPTNKCTLVPPA
jgi:hypothetical protein